MPPALILMPSTQESQPKGRQLRKQWISYCLLRHLSYPHLSQSQCRVQNGRPVTCTARSVCVMMELPHPDAILAAGALGGGL